MRSCFVGNVVAVFEMLKPSFMRCRNGVVFFSPCPSLSLRAGNHSLLMPRAVVPEEN